jgi:DNA excision repair protein ERCC-1
MDEEYDDADFIAAAAAVERNTPAAGGSAPPRSNGVVQPKPQALPSRQGPSAILVSTRQKGNPILNHIKSLPWEWTDTPCDYVLGATTCALFLSLKYHRLHPEYIYGRIRALGKLYNLRIVLTMVDIQNHEEALKELSKTSMINNLTLILCWSAQEAGRYLELFKSYEHASPASIRAHQAETYRESLTEFVTTPRTINKTDAASLISNFGSLQQAVNAQPEELALVPGWGEKKVKSWVSVVREPFRVKRAARATAPTPDSATGSMTPDRPGSTHTPIPISTVPSLLRGNTRPESSHLKRVRLEEIRPGELDGADEAILLAEAEAEATRPERVQPARPVRKEPELAEGIAAALVKLREKG